MGKQSVVIDLYDMMKVIKNGILEYLKDDDSPEALRSRDILAILGSPTGIQAMFNMRSAINRCIEDVNLTQME